MDMRVRASWWVRFSPHLPRHSFFGFYFRVLCVLYIKYVRMRIVLCLYIPFNNCVPFHFISTIHLSSSFVCVSLSLFFVLLLFGRNGAQCACRLSLLNEFIFNRVFGPTFPRCYLLVQKLIAEWIPFCFYVSIVSRGVLSSLVYRETRKVYRKRSEIVNSERKSFWVLKAQIFRICCNQKTLMIMQEKYSLLFLNILGLSFFLHSISVEFKVGRGEGIVLVSSHIYPDFFLVSH